MGINWGHIVERRIQEATDEGKFDDLPGKGQPLNLEEDMSTPPHLRVANRILKNAGVLPDWMQLGAELERSRENIRKTWERLEKEYPRRKRRAVAPKTADLPDPEKRKLAFARWLVKERAACIQAMKSVNTDITKLLLIAPSIPRVHLPYKLAEEITRFDETFPGLPGVEVPPPPTDERDATLKNAARSLYAARFGRR